MTIPSWIWLAGSLALLVVPPLWQAHVINRRRDNFRAIDAERAAREAAAPLGNVDRYFG